MNPAHDHDWKATLLVELGTRADSAGRMAEIVRKGVEKRPELRSFAEGLVGEYWPAFRALVPEARDSFAQATLLLFDSSFGEGAWILAGMAAGRAVEVELRASVFEPFASAARRTRPLPRSAAAGGPAEPLVDFIERGARSRFTMAAMVNCLVDIGGAKQGVQRSLHDWLKTHKRGLLSALELQRLNTGVDIGTIRNRATHASITKDEAAGLYKACRKWLDELTRDK
jgi:hypothetical protein